MKNRITSLLFCTAIAATLLVGCGDARENGADNSAVAENNTTEDNASEKEAAGRVYYLNFKPEVTPVWEGLAERYTEETGVPVKVVTAASGTYEQTLMSEIANAQAPTLFQINGPIGYQNWKDYCADWRNTELYSWLLDKDMALTGEDDGVYGIPYVVEGYGIIYNDAIMQKYFALNGAKATSMEEINSFEDLEAVVEDMQERRAELGIEGVFASTSLMPGEDWRWHTHLANIPVFYEYRDKNINDTDALEFTYAENFENVFDLYLENSITAPGLLGSRSVDDSMAEFALGKVAMVQNGNWGWGQIAATEGNVVAAEDVKFLPIYTGIEGEENQGLCIGTENFMALNSQASPEDRAASVAFLEWVFSSETGKSAVANELGFIAPFNTFTDEERPEDPLAQEVLRYMSDETKTSVTWTFTTFPSLQFKEDFGSALLEYSSGAIDWEDVEERVVESWAAEKEAIASR